MVVQREDKEKDDYQVSSWAPGVGRRAFTRKRGRNRSEGKEAELNCKLKLELSVSLPSGDAW